MTEFSANSNEFSDLEHEITQLTHLNYTTHVALAHRIKRKYPYAPMRELSISQLMTCLEEVTVELYPEMAE